MQIVAPILRGVQIVFSAIVLGLSVSLARGQAPPAWRDETHAPGVPATTNFSAVTGAWGLIVAAAGLASAFWEPLQGTAMAVLDTTAAVLFLAGGVAVAVGLRGVACSASDDGVLGMYLNGLLNGGCYDDGKVGQVCWYTDRYVLRARCQKDKADSVFMFFCFVVCAALVAHAFLMGGRGSGRGGLF